MSTELCFNDVRFSVFNHRNQIWIRSGELANALGYSDEKAVNKLYARNDDEFTPDMTQLADITDGANLTPVKLRIFSPRGCYLISMLARTPMAKSFRRWVLDVLEKYGDRVQPQPALPSEPLALSTTEQRKPLDKLIKVWAQQSHVHHAQLWTQVNAHFNLNGVSELPTVWIPDAIAWVQEKIDALPKALPEPKALPAAKLTLEEDIELFAEEVRQAHAQIYALREQSEKRIIARATEIMSTLALRFMRKAHPSEQGKVGVLVTNLSPYVVQKCQMALHDTSDNLYSFKNSASLLMDYAELEGRW